MKKILRVLRHVRGYSRSMFLNILFNILSVVFSLFSLTMIAPFLNLLFLKTDADYKEYVRHGNPGFHFSAQSIVDNFNYYLTTMIIDQGKLKALVVICLMVVTFIFLKNVFRYLAMYFLATIRNGVVKDLRNELYEKTLKLPLSYYTSERKGDLMSRMTTDVHDIEWSIMSSLEMIFRDPLTILAYIITMVIMSPQLTIFIFLLLPLPAIVIGKIASSLRKSSSSGKEKLGVLFSMLEETLSGLRILKAFNAEAHVTEKFKDVNEHYTKQMLKMYRKTDLAGPLSEFLGVGILVILIYMGGKLVIDTTLSPSVFITYIAVFSQVLPPAKAITVAYYNVQKGIASTERIEKILDAEETIKNSAHPTTINAFESSIEYSNVSFAYTKGDIGHVLKDINLKIDKGKTIAIVGQSGSGKTTLADMIPRFYDPTAGEVLIDGKPLPRIEIESLRSLMGIVSQESILFNDTVFNNIALGMPNATIGEVKRAAMIANAYEFIAQMPDEYETMIGDRGSKLSGGQRQRISIARAVLKNPPILILDEATSALDTESERLVQDALTKLMQNRTSIVIAHRLSTIQHADEIIVMQKGQIIERGTHNHLISQGGAYKKLYDMQAFV